MDPPGYFVAVGVEPHFGRAMQRLRLSQPALSRRFDLEHEIGFQLFDAQSDVKSVAGQVVPRRCCNRRRSATARGRWSQNRHLLITQDLPGDAWSCAHLRIAPRGTS